MTPGVRDDGRRWSYSCFAKVHVRCAGGSCACECHVGPFIPLSLAQRILAALDHAVWFNATYFDEMPALIDEFRARMPR